jgi:hypothetical protein
MTISVMSRFPPVEFEAMMRRRLRVLLISVTVVAGSLTAVVPGFTVPGSAHATAVAPGCTAAKPTRLGGEIFGYPDNRFVDAIIGVETKDAAGNTVDLDGASHAPGYTYVERVNPTLPAEGSTTSGTKTWGGVCTSSKIVETFIEMYPKAPSNATDKSRYGEAAHYYQPITVGGDNQVGLRLPLKHDLGGNTGYVNGYLTHGGHRIDPALITRVRAFTHGRGPECGVEGLAASADALGYSASLDATYYKIDALAGGRCGAPSQSYTIYLDCACGSRGSVITESRAVDITDGGGLRVDIAF